MEDSNGKVKSLSRKRLRKTKALEFEGWGSKNLIEFLQSLGKDTTNKISEYDVTDIVLNYIRGINREDPSNKNKKTKTKTKMVACDDKLSLLFECQKINILKVPDLVEKHYVENQDDDSFYDDLFASEDDDRPLRLFSSGKVSKQKKRVVQKPKGIFAAIVRDNIKFLYLRKSLVEELAKTPETFESKVMGTFVRLKNPPQLVHVTDVKGNMIDGYILEVTNYTYYLEDVTTSGLSDDDFSKEECEELDQRLKNGFAKRLTVADMEEKARSLHEDVIKHWIARELVILRRRIDIANEKGKRRELFEYLEKRELLSNPEEQSRLLLEVPEVIAEVLEPVRVDDDGKIEDDITIPKLEAHEVMNFKLPDGEDRFCRCKYTQTASAGDKDLYEDVEQQLENDITQNKDTITEGDMNTKVSQQQSSIPEIDLSNQPQPQSTSLEIIDLNDNDDDDDDDDEAYQMYDTKKVMWLYEYPEGKTQGPFSLTALNKWNEDFFSYVPDFKVWMTGQSKKSAVLLSKLLTAYRNLI